MVTTGLAAFSKYATPHIGGFAMMFKWLPDAAVDWYDVWLGAA
jgi:hypothetical protein